MARNIITTGITGDTLSTYLNSNFSELYMNNVVRVGAGGYSTIQAAITASSSGTTILISPGTYTEQIILKDGVNLLGAGVVTIYNTGTSSHNLTASSVTCVIENVIISGAKCLNFSSSNITFKNVTVGANALATTSTITGTTLSMNRSSFTNVGGTSAHTVTILGSSTVFMDLLLLDSVTISAKENSSLTVLCDVITASTCSVGSSNTYTSDITGVVGTYKDKTATNFANYLAFNLADKSLGQFVFKATKGGACNVTSYSSAFATLASSNCPANSVNGGLSLIAFDQSKITVTNSHIVRFSALHGAFIELVNSISTYDRDILPIGNVNQYDPAFWGDYSQGSHIVEQSSLYNSDMIATVRIHASTLNYMGDDVLNSLPESIALKNLAVNDSFISTSAADPAIPNPILGAWATGQSYTAGQFITSPTFSPLGGSVVLYVVTNHTSGVLQTDWKAGKIRTLFGARKQDTGYYCALYYSITSGAWKVGFRLGAHHGGRYRNRGCAMYNSSNAIQPANMIITDSVINDHANTFTLTTNANTTIDQEGAPTYGGGTTIQAGAAYTYINNVTYNYIGYHGDGRTHNGIIVQQNPQLPKETHHVYNLSLTGKAIASGVRILIAKQSGGVNVANNKLFLGNITFSEGANITPAITQYYQGSNVITGTSAVIAGTTQAYKTYYDSYIEFKDSKYGSSAMQNTI